MQGKLADQGKLSSAEMQRIIESCRDPSMPMPQLPHAWQVGSAGAAAAAAAPAALQTARSGSASQSGVEMSEGEAGESKATSGGRPQGQASLLLQLQQHHPQPGSPTARAGPPRRAKAAAPLAWADSSQEPRSEGGSNAAVGAAAAAGGAALLEWRGLPSAGSPTSGAEPPAKRQREAAPAGQPNPGPAAAAGPNAILQSLSSQLGSRLDLLLSAMHTQQGGSTAGGAAATGRAAPNTAQVPPSWLLPMPPPPPATAASGGEQQQQQREAAAAAVGGVIRPLPTRAAPSASDPMQLERTLVGSSSPGAAGPGAPGMQAAPGACRPAEAAGPPAPAELLLSPFTSAAEDDPEKVAALLKQLANVFDHQSKLVAAAAKAKRGQQQLPAEQRSAGAAAMAAALEQAGKLPQAMPAAGTASGAFPLGSIAPLLWAAGPPVPPPQLPLPPQLTGVLGQPSVGATLSSTASGMLPLEGSTGSGLLSLGSRGGCSDLLPLRFIGTDSLLPPPRFAAGDPERQMQALMSGLGSSEGSMLSGGTSLSLPLHIVDQLMPRRQAQPFK